MKLRDWRPKLHVCLFTLAGPVLEQEIPGSIPVTLHTTSISKGPTEKDRHLVYNFHGRPNEAYLPFLQAILGNNTYNYEYVPNEVSPIDGKREGFDPAHERGMLPTPFRSTLTIGSLSDIVWLKAGDKLGDHTVLKDAFAYTHRPGGVRWPTRYECFLVGPTDLLSNYTPPKAISTFPTGLFR